MEAAHLVDMANRIGRFFQALPDRDEALTGVAQHIGNFWEPRMRRQILALLDTPEAETLAPLVAEALRCYRSRLEPPIAKPVTAR